MGGWVEEWGSREEFFCLAMGFGVAKRWNTFNSFSFFDFLIYAEGVGEGRR
jgi:hypothetical protein